MNSKIVPFNFEYTKIDILDKNNNFCFVRNNKNERIYKIFRDRNYCIDITENWSNILQEINIKDTHNSIR